MYVWEMLNINWYVYCGFCSDSIQWQCNLFVHLFCVRACECVSICMLECILFFGINCMSVHGCSHDVTANIIFFIYISNSAHTELYSCKNEIFEFWTKIVNSKSFLFLFSTIKNFRKKCVWIIRLLHTLKIKLANKSVMSFLFLILWLLFTTLWKK